MNTSKEEKVRFLIFILVFISGFSVMAIEMTASRILIPYFGNSLFVWANIIGIVMLALALGYYFGGRIADRLPDFNILNFIVLIGGLFSSIIPLFYKKIISLVMVSTDYSSLVFSSFISTIILFLLPILLLGVVSPFSIRLLSKKVETAGNVAGTIYALGTIGSILGTFFASFYFIPFWGSRETIIFSGFLLILVSSINLAKRKKYIFLLFLLVPVIVYFSTVGFLKNRTGLVYEKESAYNLIQIFKEDDNYYLSFNEGSGIHSVYNPNEILTGTYYDFNNLLPYFLKTEPRQILYLGLGGGTSSRQYLHYYKDKFNLTIDAVEIDVEVIRAASKYFDLENQEINIINTDARNFLKMTDQQYDIIMIDVFNNRYNLPFHLTTREFFQELKERLRPDGIVAINILINPRLREYMGATLKSEFSYVYISPVAEESINEFVVVSDRSLVFSNLTSMVEHAELKPVADFFKKNYQEFTAFDPKKILVDNKAPIELISPIL